MRPTKRIMDSFNRFLREQFDVMRRGQKSYTRERKYEHIKIQEVALNHPEI
jgi:hypothetical protein